MSDLTEWIKERRRIHDAATEGPWTQDEQDGVRGVDLYTNTDDEGFEDRWERQDADIGTTSADDATFIVDAHATLPALLAAVEKVLELHSELTIYALDDSNGTWVYGENGERRVIRRLCLECTSDEVVELVGDGEWLEGWTDSEEVDWPCGTVRAIEGVINEQ